MRSLQKNLTGLAITGVTINLSKVIRLPGAEEFKSALTGRSIESFGRRGKYLLIHLSGGYTLVIHLRMTGRLVYADPGDELPRHTHVILQLDNGRELRFTDIRQFGRMILIPTESLGEAPELRDLGREPLEKGFTRDFLRKELRRRRTRLKALLLDQTFIAGLGNIYVDEALHRARLHPERLANSLNPREVTRIFHAIQEVLEEGINNRGTSFRDYVDGDGRSGNYQELLRVYSREGHPCPNCRKPINRIKVSGRSTYFCPCCQKP
jgi:formamidopyrimidine-DNA glycosylase